MFDDPLEREWMARMAQGDTGAFDALYRAYAGPIGTFLFRLCYDRPLAEDCLQEVFLRVWKAAPGWRGQCKVSTFLFQIAKNYGLNARDRLLRERGRLDDGAGGAERSEEGDPHASLAAGVPAAPASEPASSLLEEELRGLVRQALEALPEEQRIILQLSQSQGLTCRDIAAILQLPLGTVKSRLSAGFASLRGRLQRHVRA